MDFETDECVHHMVGFFLLAKNPTGKLIEETREGKNSWINFKDIYNYMYFPDIEYTIPSILEDKGHIQYLTATRYMKNGKFMTDEEIKDLKNNQN